MTTMASWPGCCWTRSTAWTAQIGQLTARIGELIAAIPAAQGVDADGTTGPAAGLGEDAPVLPAVVRLDEVTGIGRDAAQVIIAEVGLDMTVFPTAGHLVSWAKLSPRTIQSGARHRSGQTGKGNPYLKGVLGEAAAAAARTDTFLGERYRRIVKRRGKLKALVAVARSILVIVWHLLADPTARYQRPRRRLLRQPHRQGPQDPQPHPPARSPRLHRHPGTTPPDHSAEPGSADAPPDAAALARGHDFPVSDDPQAGPTAEPPN